MANNKIIKSMISFLERVDARFLEKSSSKKPKKKAGFKRHIKRNKRLTTWIGKLIERINYPTIAILIASLIVLCGLYFWLSGNTRHEVSLLGGMYFSIITFTSLGYGDVVPLGFGKVVAATEVLCGLILVAVFVGKLASERQSALLLLIYTSEHQRRLSDFTMKFNQQTVAIDMLLENHDHNGLFQQAKRSYRFASSVNNYLLLQTNQGGLASYGNFSSLRRIYKAMIGFQKMTFEAIQSFGTPDSTLVHLERIMFRIDGMAKSMVKFHEGDPGTLGLLLEICNRTKILNKWHREKELGLQHYRYRSELNDFIIHRIKPEIPVNYKVKGAAKGIAGRLGLTIKLVQRAIAELEHRGEVSDKNEAEPLH